MKSHVLKVYLWISLFLGTCLAQQVPVSPEKWQVAIVHSQLGYRICGASLVNEQFLITAASCVHQHDANDLVAILEQDFERHRVAALLPRINPNLFQRSRISRSEVHPEYNAENGDNDIAILELAQAIIYSDTIGPICLPDKEMDSFFDMMATQGGWGVPPVAFGPNPWPLAKQNLKILRHTDCGDQRRICAKTGVLQYKECQGDKGGSLHTYFNLYQPILIGIVPSVKTCPIGNEMATYTRITPYLDWIHENMHGVLSCVPYRT